MGVVTVDEFERRRWDRVRRIIGAVEDTTPVPTVQQAFMEMASAAPVAMGRWLRWVGLLLPVFHRLVAHRRDEGDAWRCLDDLVADALEREVGRDLDDRTDAEQLARLMLDFRRLGWMFDAVTALHEGLATVQTPEDLRRLVRGVAEASPSAAADVDRLSLSVFEVEGLS